MVGEKAKVRDLLYGLLLPSGNDVAVALAEHFGKRLRDPKAPPSDAPLDTLTEFTDEMNRRAIRIGMNRTTFLDPHGNSKNMSTTQDLLRLTWMAMQNPLFRKYVNTRVYRCEIIKTDGTKRRVTWINTNRMLGIDGFDGVKTGTTSGAGACLVASGWRGKDNILVVVLGSTQGDGRYVDTRNLFRWA
jgi:D-alanyl-D-alanine carboxypeptidase (penicillin-binding protein 5/6)